ncbi:Rv0909 family putative TA system antitoxin [Nocardioides yefusunii]|uniref:Rv0909 family putative TA system antitoxin n=1 Tax=Nocardioides yefusunii TaxID=2500546 RepID=A0ABW1R364_9ACTN|nr:Rv0909 family putative TA system antitoxin [Nocardioides yefusunii]
MTSYSDKIKAKIKESDVEGKLGDLVDDGEKLVNEAVTKAGTLAHDRRDDVVGWLDKASETVNSKTDGKYADRVSKLRDVLLAGLDKVADKRAGSTSDDDVDREPRGELPPVE